MVCEPLGSYSALHLVWPPWGLFMSPPELLDAWLGWKGSSKKLRCEWSAALWFPWQSPIPRLPLVERLTEPWQPHGAAVLRNRAEPRIG